MKPWKSPRELGLPDPIHPDLEYVPEDEWDEWDCDGEVAEFAAVFHGRETYMRGQSPSGDDFPPPPKHARAWCDSDGGLGRVLRWLGLAMLRRVIRWSFRAALRDVYRDPRCTGMTRDLIRERLLGRE